MIVYIAANGIQVIDRSNSDAVSVISLGYEPTNIATDGDQLFVVGVEYGFVDVINTITETVIDSISLPHRHKAISANHFIRLTLYLDFLYRHLSADGPIWSYTSISHIFYSSTFPNRRMS